MAARGLETATAKEIDSDSARHPPRTADPPQGSGHAGPHGDHPGVLITVSIAPASAFKIDGLNWRLDLPTRSMKRLLGASARADARRRGRVAGANTSSAALPSQGQRPRANPRPAIFMSRCASCSGGKDAELEELMTKWRNENHTIRARHG